MSIVLLVASYEDAGQPNALWAIYFVMMMVPFGAYFFLQLPLGIACIIIIILLLFIIIIIIIIINNNNNIQVK